MMKKTIVDYIGCFAIFVAIVASLMLAATRLGLIESLPGCGVGSGCDLVTNGRWGAVPFLHWPVSFLGVAWFSALFVNWLKGDSSKCFLWMVRLGAIGSLCFILLMAGIGSFCKWCFVAHVCNWIFWVCCELSNKKIVANGDSCQRMKWGSFVSTCILVTLALGAADFAAKERKKKLALENEGQVVEGVRDQSTLALLVARHRLGPENALVQIVMFTDYQCPDCKRYETQISNILNSRSDVSVSIKHFPLCFDCNDNIGDYNLHPNACWAARASEAAAMIGGGEKWEQMHEWLFEQGGSFTDQTFPNALAVLGYNPGHFTQVMMSEETKELVMQDADDGYALGVYYTPMIFINGVEYLWYYGGEDSLARVVARVANAAKDGNFEMVTPPNLSGKLIEDWRRGQEKEIRYFDHASWLGDGEIDFVVWGDYQSSQSVELDREVQAALKKYPNIRYAFRHFPIDKECNRFVKDYPKNYDGSCFIAKLVEAVGVLGGDDARWTMHQWIIESPLKGNQGVTLAKASELLGVDQLVVRDVMASIEVEKRIQNDVVAKNAAWRKGVPVLVIGGRVVPRWRSEDLPAVELIHRIVGLLEEETSR